MSGAVQRLDGFVVLSCFGFGPAEEEMSPPEIGLGFDHFAGLLDALVVLTREQEADGEKQADRVGERIEFTGFGELVESFLLPAHGNQVVAAPLVSGGGTGIEFDASFKFCACGWKIVVVESVDHGEHGVGFGERFVELQGFGGGVFHFGHGFSRGEELAGEEEVRVGDADVGLRVVGIAFDGLMKIFDAALNAGDGGLIGVETALKVELEGFGVAGVLLGERGVALGIAAQAHAKIFVNFAGDFLLDGEEIGEFHVVLLAPDVAVVARVGEFRADGEIVAALDDAAGEDGAGGKFAADDARVDGFALVAEDGAASDDF